MCAHEVGRARIERPLRPAKRVSTTKTARTDCFGECGRLCVYDCVCVFDGELSSPPPPRCGDPSTRPAHRSRWYINIIIIIIIIIAIIIIVQRNAQATRHTHNANWLLFKFQRKIGKISVKMKKKFFFFKSHGRKTNEIKINTFLNISVFLQKLKKR